MVMVVVLKMVHYDSGGEGKGDDDDHGKPWYPAAPALRQGVRKDVVGGVGSSDDGSRGDGRGDGRADGDGVCGKLWKVMICSSKSSGSRRERRSGWYDDVAFGVSSDDGGGDDCGDEDDLDRGGDFDCSSFRGGPGCGVGDGDGDGGHVDCRGSKSQLIINLVFS